MRSRHTNPGQHEHGRPHHQEGNTDLERWVCSPVRASPVRPDSWVLRRLPTTDTRTGDIMISGIDHHTLQERLVACVVQVTIHTIMIVHNRSSHRATTCGAVHPYFIHFGVHGRYRTVRVFKPHHSRGTLPRPHLFRS